MPKPFPDKVKTAALDFVANGATYKETIRKIKILYGHRIAYSTLRQWLKAGNVKSRNKVGRPRKFSDALIKYWVSQYKSGVPVTKIAQNSGQPRETVRDAISKTTEDEVN